MNLLRDIRVWQALVARQPSMVILPRVLETASNDQGFQVRLQDFEGPFDLLLHLIAKHKLEVTELALHVVTDDFIAHLRQQGSDWDLDETTEFLVVAATLLDLKSARLLPSGEVEDEEDLQILEARDLLFARLLQYRAYKEVSGQIAALMTLEERRFRRVAALPEPFASLLPEVLVAITPDQLAALAAAALQPRPAPPSVSLSHLHNPAVSVREQAFLIGERIKRRGNLTFRALVQDAESTAVIVARFLALLEMFREQLVVFDQAAALGELNIRWIGQDAMVEIVDEFENEPEDDRND